MRHALNSERAGDRKSMARLYAGSDAVWSFAADSDRSSREMDFSSGALSDFVIEAVRNKAVEK